MTRQHQAATLISAAPWGCRRRSHAFGRSCLSRHHCRDDLVRAIGRGRLASITARSWTGWTFADTIFPTSDHQRLYYAVVPV
jgi:hypothetical protein